MDKKIGSLMEAGLTKFYFDKEMDKIARIANSKVSSVRVVPLNLVHLSGPFLLWLLALSICILVFFHELSFNYRVKLRQRTLDSIRQWNIEEDIRKSTLKKAKPIHEYGGKNTNTRTPNHEHGGKNTNMRRPNHEHGGKNTNTIRPNHEHGGKNTNARRIKIEPQHRMTNVEI